MTPLAKRIQRNLQPFVVVHRAKRNGWRRSLQGILENGRLAESPAMHAPSRWPEPRHGAQLIRDVGEVLGSHVGLDGAHLTGSVPARIERWTAIVSERH